MEERFSEILRKGLDGILPDSRDELLFPRLCRLYDEITLFNPKYGLVNAQGEELVIRHILDCLAPAALIAQTVRSSGVGASVRMADLGSGSGLPGLVLASAFPDWDITLVERMGRRAGFLRNTVAMMKLASNVHILQKDLSEVQNTYNVITFRAFRPFKDIVCDLDRILEEGGSIFAYKSSQENIDEETAAISAYERSSFDCSVVPYDVPMLKAARRMLIVRRTGSTKQPQA